MILGQLRLQLVNMFVGEIVVNMDVRLLQAESLADRQLDHLGARGRRLLNRLEQREVVERIGLAADGEAADPAILRNRVGH